MISNKDLNQFKSYACSTKETCNEKFPGNSNMNSCIIKIFLNSYFQENVYYLLGEFQVM